jgi:hypothetical protein
MSAHLLVIIGKLLVGLYHTAVFFWAYIQLNTKQIHSKVGGLSIAKENQKTIMQNHIDLFDAFDSPWPIASNFRDSISHLAEKQIVSLRDTQTVS